VILYELCSFGTNFGDGAEKDIKKYIIDIDFK